MRTLPLLALVAALAGATGAEETKPVQAPHGPRLSVEPASFDFGKALPNRTLEKEFNLRNFGDEELVIEKVTTSCGCTVTQLDTKLLKPGASTPLRVKLETRSAQGRILKSVAIRSNDATKSVFELKLEATVVPEKAR